MKTFFNILTALQILQTDEVFIQGKLNVVQKEEESRLVMVSNCQRCTQRSGNLIEVLGLTL